jgi:hypothetical protein
MIFTALDGRHFCMDQRVCTSSLTNLLSIPSEAVCVSHFEVWCSSVLQQLRDNSVHTGTGIHDEAVTKGNMENSFCC